MAQKTRPTSDSVCACGRRLRWEARQTHEGTRWLAVCRNPECGQLVVPVRDGADPDTALQDFLMDGRPPTPYKAPWVRLFLQSTEITRWRGDDICPSCGSVLAFKTNFRPAPDRPVDPFEVAMCLACGRTQISLWNPPGIHTIVLSDSAWNGPENSVLALKQAVRYRVGARRRHAE
jgi:hypothetical protein